MRIFRQYDKRRRTPNGQRHVVPFMLSKALAGPREEAAARIRGSAHASDPIFGCSKREEFMRSFIRSSFALVMASEKGDSSGPELSVREFSHSTSLLRTYRRVSSLGTSEAPTSYNEMGLVTPGTALYRHSTLQDYLRFHGKLHKMSETQIQREFVGKISSISRCNCGSK